MNSYARGMTSLNYRARTIAEQLPLLFIVKQLLVKWKLSSHTTQLLFVLNVCQVCQSEKNRNLFVVAFLAKIQSTSNAGVEATQSWGMKDSYEKLGCLKEHLLALTVVPE